MPLIPAVAQAWAGVDDRDMRSDRDKGIKNRDRSTFGHGTWPKLQRTRDLTVSMETSMLDMDPSIPVPPRALSDPPGGSKVQVLKAQYPLFTVAYNYGTEYSGTPLSLIKGLVISHPFLLSPHLRSLELAPPWERTEPG